MAFYLNKVQLAGNITNDLELRTTSTGLTYTKFTLAVNEKKNGEQVTQFINCVLWGKPAEALCTYCTKGSSIYVEGKLAISQYKDKNYPDVTHISTSVTCSQFNFTGSKPAAEAPAAAGNVAAPVAQQPAQRSAQPSANQSSGGFKQGDLKPTSLDGFEEIIGDADLPF